MFRPVKGIDMKLLLADDHTLFRDALVQYIERSHPGADISLAKDFHEAFAIMEASPEQDLVLLDFCMPGMNKLGGLKKMRKSFPDVPVALMSGVAEPEDIYAAMDMGAAGYFPKTLSGRALLQAIQLVLNGERFMPFEGQTQNIMPSYYSDTPKQFPYSYVGISEEQKSFEDTNRFNLTPGEKDVLEHLVLGEANKEIADALGLQVVTVKLHVRGICRKLDAKNRTQAALIAHEQRLC